MKIKVKDLKQAIAEATREFPSYDVADTGDWVKEYPEDNGKDVPDDEIMLAEEVLELVGLDEADLDELAGTAGYDDLSGTPPSEFDKHFEFSFSRDYDGALVASDRKTGRQFSWEPSIGLWEDLQ